MCDGREQDSGWIDLLVPAVGPRTAAEDFVATTWAPGMTHPALLAEFAARTRQLGLNSEFGSSLYAMSEHGLPCGGYIGVPSGAFRCEKFSGNGVRPYCLSDPAVVAQFTTWAKDTADKQQPYGMFAVGITDEAFLTSRHTRDEVCFCPHCQHRYRTWLESRYKTLGALNAQWGTSYAAWEDIRGARTEDVRGRSNFAPFVDFRTFMTDVWIDGCRTITAAYHQAAPQTPVGHTNTFGQSPSMATTTGNSARKSGSAGGKNTPRPSRPRVKRRSSTCGGVSSRRPSRGRLAAPAGPPARTTCSSITAGSATTTGRRQPIMSPGGWPCMARAA